MEILLGAMLGVAYVIPPGHVNIATVRHGLTGGVLVALAVQLGCVETVDLMVGQAVGAASYARATPPSIQQSFWISVAISIWNPYGVAFWL